ncbi:DUF1090 domain-containing protein [Providencia sp. Me31A]|uniref:DUF1090 domain-containing protein n=1 Tax=Providencia sp. Me31A TaxID=3392637 RepID=UPI003D2BB460
MKKLTVITTVLMLSIGGMSVAQAAQSCNDKASAIEREIRIAEQFGNYNKVAGLKQALYEVNMHCTDASVKKDAQKKVDKLERKLADKRQDVAEVEYDLQKAKAKGDQRKVIKYQNKLAEKQRDVRQLEQELNQARAELAAL